MNLDKTERMNNLLDLYENLLTDKQREIMDLYYRYDLSLAEIAEDTNTTRSAVFDLIKRVNKILEDYESKLNLLSKREEILKLIENIDEEVKEKIENLL